MHQRVLIFVFLVLFLLGCATTRKGEGTSAQELHRQIEALETELQAKDEEISILENELAKVKSTSTKQQKLAKAETQLSIKQIQTALKNAGFYKGQVDGKIGPQTKESIKAFQKVNNLKPDGIIGKRTSEKLSMYLP